MGKVRKEAEMTWSQYFSTVHILNGIKKRSELNTEAQFDDLYSLLWKEDNIFMAINKLRPNKGTSTAGLDKVSFDAFSNKNIIEIRQRLKEKKYSFSPFKRKMIPKPGKTTKRPLGIPTFHDRVVQEMIREILDKIYEPVFRITHQNANRGFRPGMGCHDSINDLLLRAKGMDWCIEGDIKGAYDNVNHQTMLNILGKKIKDPDFIKLIKSGLECGLVKDGKFEHTILGTPQGGIASPILFNIYISKLDEFVLKDLANEIEEINIQEGRKAKPVTKSYERLRGKTRTLQRKLDKGMKDDKIESQVAEMKRKNLKIPYLDKKRTVIRIVYARYADDWVLFTNGSFKLASILKEKINDFLRSELSLELSPDKTKITNIGTDRVKFLGYSLGTYKENQKVMYVTNASDQQLGKKRTTGVNLVAGIDQDRLESRLVIKSFITTNGQGGYKSRRKPEWTVLSDYEIVQRFNYVIRGLANYYIMVRDVSLINKYSYLLRFSCAHTLANKHNLSLTKTFKRYGNLITVMKPSVKEKETGIKREKSKIENNDKVSLLSYIETAEIMKKMKLAFIKMKNSKNSQEQVVDIDRNDPLAVRVNWRTAYRLAQHCVICGSIEQVEMHHIRHVRKMGQTATGFGKVMAQINRKQIPTCRKCHERIHAGLYDGMSLSELYDPDLVLI